MLKIYNKCLINLIKIKIRKLIKIKKIYIKKISNKNINIYYMSIGLPVKLLHEA